MPITSDALKNEIESLRAQYANAQATAQQALGAIALAEALLKQLEEKDALTLGEFADALGVESAEIVK